MIQIVINEEKTLEIKGIRTREGGLLIKRVGSLIKRAQTDEEFRHSFNGLIALASADSKISSGTVISMMPIIIANFYDELLGLLSDLTGMTVEEIEDLELDKTIEIICAIVEETDFNKVINLIKNFKGLKSVQ